MSQTIESVAILGGGFMGAGIAESASIAGVPVIIRELPEFIDAARARLEKSLDGAVKRGKLDAGQRAASLANITFTSELKDVAGRDLVKDRSGFIVNFLLTPYHMAGIRMFEEGFASREDIDAAMKLGAGHPMGPLTLCDFIGLDVLNAICVSLYEEFKRPEYAPPPPMKRMIAAGRLGRKSGKGFYDYA